MTTLETVLLALAGPTVALATLVYTINSQRKKASSEALDRIDERMTRAENRVTRLEGQIDSLPDRDVTHRLELSLSEMRGELKVLAQRLEPVAATSERLQEYLLEQAK